MQGGWLLSRGSIEEGDQKQEPPTTPIERVVVAVRVAVVLSIAVLLMFGPDLVRRHLSLAVVLLLVAGGYAYAVVLNPRWELRRSWSAWSITGMDSVLSLLAVATTGAAASPTVTVLVLVVVSAAIRLSLPATVSLACVLSASYIAITVFIDPHVAPVGDRVLGSLWWTVYLLLTAVLGATLSLLAEREHEARAAARVEAIAEHRAADEERDLRARLVESYQAQRDGLRVILHEFRTPVSSLRALTKEVVNPDAGIGAEDWRKSAQLVCQHVEHLAEMLDALGDVAASQDPSFSAGRMHKVDLGELLVAAGDAAGLHPPRLRIVVHDRYKIRIDSQRLRRVVTNLLENAAHHGQGTLVEVQAWSEEGFLHVRVLDQGAGATPAQLDELTDKGMRAGENPGNAGLGLWIVEQIVYAMGGRFELDCPKSGGFVARFKVPVN